MTFKINTTLKSIIVLTYLLCVCIFKLMAQIEGNVNDTDGNAIKGAIIIATDAVGNIIDSIATDTIGYYAFKNLKKGKYELTVKATGFETALHKNINVKNEKPDSEPGPADISNGIWLQVVLERRKSGK